MAEQGTIETRSEAEQGDGGDSKYWQGQLELSEKNSKDFITDGKEVIRRYKNEKAATQRANNKKYNILFSNTETLKAAVFARMGKPDIRRRFADRDPIGKQVAEIIERAALYCQDAYDSEKAVEHAIEDYLLPGRGIVRVCYEATTATGDDKKEYISDQDLYEEYWPWDDFRHEPSKTWDKVTWEAFRHRMTRKELRENFAKLGAEQVNKIPLNWSPKPDDNKLPDAFKRAEVWEIFDKSTRQRFWVVNGFDRLCRTDPDPYGLENFFPNAEPLQAVTSNDTLIPKSEFSVYQDQADGLDEIEARVDRLTRALKRRGVYDATFKELARLAKANDNEFIAVKNYSDLSTKGGLAAAFQTEDLKAIADVLSELHSQRDLRVQTIYEVVGIADIMRGSSDPRETLGAQKIKAQFGGNRLKKRQDKVQKWIRDTLRIKAEIIAEHFEPQKLAEMTGFKYVSAADMAQMQQAQQPQMPAPGGMPGQPMAGQQPAMPPQQAPSVDGLITDDMIKIMRSDKLRSYRIDIETDSTLFEDAEEQKQATTEMLTAASEFVTAWFPIISAQPALLDLALEMLALALRRFKMGSSLEQVLDETKAKLEQAAQQPKPPDPKVQAEQAKAAAVQQKAQIDAAALQMDMQAAQQKHGMDMQKMQAEMAQAQQEIQVMQAKLGIDAQAIQLKADADQKSAELNSEAMQQKHDMGLEMMAQKADQARQAAKQKPRANA